MTLRPFGIAILTKHDWRFRR